MYQYQFVVSSNGAGVVNGHIPGKDTVHFVDEDLATVIKCAVFWNGFDLADSNSTDGSILFHVHRHMYDDGKKTYAYVGYIRKVKKDE